MSIQFILGRAGSGKSHYCLDEIRHKLLQSPSGNPLILLVPEQATFQAEYALVTTPEISGIIRAQALSFRRLAFRMMQETGGTTRTPIDDTGKKMLLYKTLYKRKQELRLFQHTVEQVGFVDGLNDLYNELKRYCITPLGFAEHMNKKAAHVTEQSSMLADKLHDLLMIYDDYETELSSQYIDAEDYLNILAYQLKDSNYIKQSEIWIDGFYGFTPQEFKVIEQLLKYGKNIHITLCIDREYEATERPNELDLFHPTASTLIELQEMVDKLGVSKAETILLNEAVSPRFAGQPMLAHIEQSYHHRRQWRHRTGEDDREADVNLSVHAAVHRRAEIEGAAREMLRLVRNCGYRWRDMAVMVRNAVDYQDLLTAAFTDYGIPFFFDQKQPVMHHPLIEFIRSALEVTQFNWRYDSIFRCIKTDFLLPIDSSNGSIPRTTRHTMDELENYVLAFGIQGYRWYDSKPWGKSVV